MYLKNTILTLGLMCLCACQSSAGFQAPLNNHDYGPAPQYDQEALKSYFGLGLKDAESARYNFGEARPAYCNNGLLSGGQVIWTGWVLPFQVNARNSYGGYVGFKNYFARYDGDKLLDVSPTSPVGPFEFSPRIGIGCKIVP